MTPAKGYTTPPQRQVTMSKMNIFFVTVFFASASTMISISDKNSELFWLIGFSMFFSSLYIVLKIKASMLERFSDENVEDEKECVEQHELGKV